MFKVDCEQFGFMFTSWTFSLCLSFIVWTPAEGWAVLIGSTQPIVAAPGDDVILPCHLVPELNVQELTVEWSRPDLEPDPTHILVYRDRREVPDMKIQTYVGRTELFTDQLVHGNISLKITNVTLADEGRYRCFIPTLESGLQSAIVKLSVARTTKTPQDPRTLQTPDPKDGKDTGLNRSALITAAVVFCVFVLFGGVVGAYFLNLRCQNQII